MDKSVGCGVVSLERGWWLGMAKFNEDMANWAGHLRIVKQCRCFCFGRAGDDMADGATFCQDRAIGRNYCRRSGVAAQEEVSR